MEEITRSPRLADVLKPTIHIYYFQSPNACLKGLKNNISQLDIKGLTWNAEILFLYNLNVCKQNLDILEMKKIVRMLDLCWKKTKHKNTQRIIGFLAVLGKQGCVRCFHAEEEMNKLC